VYRVKYTRRSSPKRYETCPGTMAYGL
jgi:hypothetical protein